jgi:hypothetical protein
MQNYTRNEWGRWFHFFQKMSNAYNCGGGLKNDGFHAVPIFKISDFHVPGSTGKLKIVKNGEFFGKNLFF